MGGHTGGFQNPMFQQMHVAILDSSVAAGAEVLVREVYASKLESEMGAYVHVCKSRPVGPSTPREFLRAPECSNSSCTS